MNLNQYERGEDFSSTGRTDPKIKWDKFKLKSECFDPAKHDVGSCQICNVAKWTPIGKHRVSPLFKPKVLGKGELPTLPGKRIIDKKMCIKCKQETGPGISHPCTKKSSKGNIVRLIEKESISGQEQVIGESLKTIVQSKKVKSEQEFRLKGLRGGNSLAIKVGTSSEPPNVLTANFMLSLKKKLNCSEAKLLTIARSLKTTGVKLEPKICEELL